MANYTLELVATSAIMEDVSSLADHDHLWRVTSGISLVAYCIDKSLADRIAHNDLYRPTISVKSNLFCYPSSSDPRAICVGTTNALLRKDDERSQSA